MFYHRVKRGIFFFFFFVIMKKQKANQIKQTKIKTKIIIREGVKWLNSLKLIWSYMTTVLLKVVELSS